MRSRLETVGSTDSSGPDLITLDALKLELGVTDESEDAVLTARIARWSQMFAEYCNRPFAFSEGVETFTFDREECWPRRQPLTLSLYPVIDIVSVTQNGSAVEYEVDMANGLIWPVNGHWSGTIVVTYSGGYFLPDQTPTGLVEAIIAQMRDARTDRDTSIQSVSHGDTRVSYFNSTATTGAICATALGFLQPFKRPVLA